MVETNREVFIDVEPHIRIRFRRSEAPPPASYAITLELQNEGRWVTVRLWDNADGIDEHHEHQYIQASGKQAPVVLDFPSPNAAMAAAITKAKAEAVEIVRQWRRS